MPEIEEVWKPVQGYEDRYAISSLGRIKSLPRPTLINRCTDRSRTLKERLLSTTVTSRGFLIVSLSKDGKGKSHNLHQLVALHFLPGEPGAQVRFKDGNKRNCAASNLTWLHQRYDDFNQAVREGA